MSNLLSFFMRSSTEWDESKHPRDDDGKFTEANSSDDVDTPYDARVGDSFMHFKEIHRDPKDRMNGGMRVPSHFKQEGMEVLGAEMRARVSDDDIARALSVYDPYRSIDPSIEQQGPEAVGKERAEMLANAFTSTWAGSSGDSDARAVMYQHAVAQALGMDQAAFGHLAPLTEALAHMERGIGSQPNARADVDALFRTMKAHTTAQYENTQRVIAGGPDTWVLVRGAALLPADADAIGRTGIATLQPISSFSTNRRVAESFSYDGPQSHRNVVIRTRVPKSRIFSMPRTGFGCLDEYEVLVLGGSVKVKGEYKDHDKNEWRALADWDESKHPRVPAGNDHGGEFAGQEFPYGDKLDDESLSEQLFDQVHGSQIVEWKEGQSAADFVGKDKDAAGKLKHGVSQRIGPALDAEFDAEQLSQLAVLLGVDGAGRSAGYSVSQSYVDMWAATSGDHNAFAVMYQHAVAEELGLDAMMGHFNDGDTVFEDLDEVKAIIENELGIGDPKSHGIDSDFVYETMKAHARAQYTNTQAELTKRNAPTVLTLHRGVTIDPSLAASVARTGTVALQPLSSFTSDHNTALDFAAQMVTASGEAYDPAEVLARGHVISLKIPRSRVFSIPKTGFGCLSEFEFVILGSRSYSGAKIKKRYGKFNSKVKPFPKPEPLDQDDPAFMPFSEAYARYMRAAGEWDESQHPRDDDGKFVEVEKSLLAEFPDVAVDIAQGKSVWTLNRVVVPKSSRGSGVGTAVMSRLVEMADKRGATIALTPSADFGGNVKRLREFYKRFGFVDNKGSYKDFSISESMLRLPVKQRDAKYNPDQPREPKGDEDGGQWTAISGRAIRGEMRPGTTADRKRLGIPPAYSDVQVTDDPKAELVATARTPKGKLASFYSDAYHDKQSAAKWARIQELQVALPDMMEQVNHDIAHKTEDRDVAMTIRLIAQTGLRNGGDAGEGIGASNLGLDNVTLVGGNKVRLQFKGKGGVDQDHTVTDKAFAAYVRERQQTSTNGRLFPHTAADTLDYQKRIGGGRFKVHDLRTHVATTLASRLAQELVAKGLQPTNLKDHKSALKQIATTVSRKLGNTPAVALSTYIHPASVEILKPKHRKAA